MSLMFKMHLGMVHRAHAVLIPADPSTLQSSRLSPLGLYAFVSLDRTPYKYITLIVFSQNRTKWNSLDDELFPPVKEGENGSELAAQLDAFKTSVRASLA